MSEYSRALGDTVRTARKKLGLSQRQVANLIDADERTVMNIEAYRANTTMDVLYPLVRKLLIDSRDIFFQNEKKNPLSIISFVPWLTAATKTKQQHCLRYAKLCCWQCVEKMGF